MSAGARRRAVLAVPLAALGALGVSLAPLTVARPWRRPDDAVHFAAAVVAALACASLGTRGTALLLGAEARAAARAGWAAVLALAAACGVAGLRDGGPLAAALLPLAPCVALAWRGTLADAAPAALRGGRGWLSYLVAITATVWLARPLVDADAGLAVAWIVLLGAGYARALQIAAAPAPPAPGGAASRARRALAPRWARVTLAAGAGFAAAGAAAPLVELLARQRVYHVTMGSRVEPALAGLPRLALVLGLALLLVAPAALLLDLDRPRPRRRAVLGTLLAGAVPLVGASWLLAAAGGVEARGALLLGFLAGALGVALARLRLALREEGRAAGLLPLALVLEALLGALALALLGACMAGALRVVPGSGLEPVLAAAPPVLVLACEIGVPAALAAARPRAEGAP